MPDYIVVFDKVTSTHIQKAKEYGQDGKPIPIIVIDTKKYGDRSYSRAYENVPVKENYIPGEFLNEVMEEAHINAMWWSKRTN